MYESFFGFTREPFTMAPDPRFLWLSETHHEGLAVLYYGLTQRKPFVLLTGEPGSGKTTLLRSLLAQIPQELESAVILNTSEATPFSLLKMIAEQFGLPVSSNAKVDYVVAITRHLHEGVRSGRRSVLIVDEAQNLDTPALEELRLLSNLTTDTENLLPIVLTGQPELRRKLAQSPLRSLRQRIVVEHHVEPLSPLEIEPYLAHRIRVVGGSYEETFVPGAEDVFFSFSSGSPRLLNLLGDRSLLAGFVDHVRPIPRAMLEQKAKELDAARGDELPARDDGES